MTNHQYVNRQDSSLVDEKFCADSIVSFLYSRVRENSGWMYRTLTSARLTNLLAMLRFDLRPVNPNRMRLRLARDLGLDLAECADPPETLDTARKIFERKICYWKCRPMSPDLSDILSPSDARIIVGSFQETSTLFLKGKLFQYEELLGETKSEWLKAFRDGDFAVLRLTPDKYHYNHAPVSGVVKDIYEIDGVYQSCHPAVIISQGTPYSKNRRTVTIIDTDVPGGTETGLVAMIEIVALMIGDIVQCYSAERYDDPSAVRPGMRLERGCPKSLFRPGSSTVVLLFQQGRVQFSRDIVRNLRRPDAQSCYSTGWGMPLTETDIAVRSTIAHQTSGGVL